MNLIASFKKNGILQRQLLTKGTNTFLRIVALVNQSGKIVQQLNVPQWQEQNHLGEFQNVTDSSKINELEKEFQKIN